MYFIKNPKVLKKIYPSLIWDIQVDDKSIYLTFDDGPVPEATPYVLDVLDHFKAKATFFCIGDNVRKHPHIYNDIIARGHSIGNHTFNHLNGWSTPTSEYIENIDECSKYTGDLLFRPPYGRISPSQIKAFKENYPDSKIIMWDVLSADFDINIDAEKCYQNVIKNASPGSIVVFHDSIKAMPRLKDALPRALENLSARGFLFRSIK